MKKAMHIGTDQQYNMVKVVESVGKDMFVYTIAHDHMLGVPHRYDKRYLVVCYNSTLGNLPTEVQALTEKEIEIYFGEEVLKEVKLLRNPYSL